MKNVVWGISVMGENAVHPVPSHLEILMFVAGHGITKSNLMWGLPWTGAASKSLAEGRNPDAPHASTGTIGAQSTGQLCAVSPCSHAPFPHCVTLIVFGHLMLQSKVAFTISWVVSSKNVALAAQNVAFACTLFDWNVPSVKQQHPTPTPQAVVASRIVNASNNISFIRMPLFLAGRARCLGS